MRGLSAIVVLCASSVALADRPPLSDDPDLEIARRHFAEGTEFYGAGRYAEALREFEVARKAKAAPELDYNIGRCHDRLEHLSDAISAYRRYLAAAPNSGEAAEVRARIEALTARIEPAAAPVKIEPPPSLDKDPVLVLPAAPPPPSRALSLAVGAVALLAAGVGIGLLAPVAADYQRLLSTCAPACEPSQWEAFPGRLWAGTIAAAAAVALAVVDVALWLAQRRSSRTP